MGADRDADWATVITGEPSVKILILEDVHVTRSHLASEIKKIAEKSGLVDYEVVDYGDPRVALRDATSAPPDLVVVDLFMPSDLVGLFGARETKWVAVVGVVLAMSYRFRAALGRPIRWGGVEFIDRLRRTAGTKNAQILVYSFYADKDDEDNEVVNAKFMRLWLDALTGMARQYIDEPGKYRVEFLVRWLSDRLDDCEVLAQDRFKKPAGETDLLKRIESELVEGRREGSIA